MYTYISERRTDSRDLSRMAPGASSFMLVHDTEDSPVLHSETTGTKRERQREFKRESSCGFPHFFLTKVPYLSQARQWEEGYSIDGTVTNHGDTTRQGRSLKKRDSNPNVPVVPSFISFTRGKGFVTTSREIHRDEEDLAHTTIL